jgi:ABC-2 type transport system ATP-binding protein
MTQLTAVGEQAAPAGRPTRAPRPATTASTGPGAPPETGLAISTRGLTKRFGSQVAVDDVDLRVPHGAVYGFLGPNGSGKTTTIRMLLGLVEPTAGSRSLLGMAIPQQATIALHRVGSLVEGPAFHPYLSGWANLVRLDAADVLADPRTTRARIGTALDRVGLTAAAGKRYRAYSLGMRQRLAIAAALLAPRDLLVLDEPTNGLDPQGTREVRSLIGSLASDGTTVFVSSHLLAEVEQICSHLGVMREGRLVAQGTTSEVRGGGIVTLHLVTAQPEEAAAVLTGLGVQSVTTHVGEVRGIPGELEPEAIVAALVRAGVGVRSFTASSPSLEDLFVSLTGEGFDVSG